MDLRTTIVITGIGLVTSLGSSIDENRRRSILGESGISPLRSFDVTGFPCQSAAAVGSFELEPLLRIPKNQKFMNRAVEMAVWAAKDALRASGISLGDRDPGRIALQLGSGQPGLEPSEFFSALDLTSSPDTPAAFNELGGRPSRMIDRYFPLRSLANAGCGLLSTELAVRGPGNNFVQSDTASAEAIGAAYYDLLEGRCDVAVAGGCDSLLTESNYLAYEHQELLSPSDPAHAYRPFDRLRDGLVLGEGAAIFVMERREEAVRRGAPILGEITGYGSAMDVSDSAQPVGCEETARAACRQAGIDSDPAFLVAHGIGTRDADRREAAFLSAIFGDKLPVTALKSQTGYLGAATAAVELGLALLGARENLIPPIARHSHPDDDCALNLVAGSARPLRCGGRPLACINWSWTGHCTVLAACPVPVS